VSSICVYVYLNAYGQREWEDKKRNEKELQMPKTTKVENKRRDKRRGKRIPLGGTNYESKEDD
jgi:hypothetical protein